MFALSKEKCFEEILYGLHILTVAGIVTSDIILNAETFMVYSTKMMIRLVSRDTYNC